jgi:hypothetical protein
MAVLSSLSRVAAASRSAVAKSTSKRSFSAIYSVADEFPDVPATTPSTLNASTASSTVLPSGLTVVTEDASSTSTLTLTFPTAGSSSESNFEAGAALANKCIAFKSGSGLSTALILRTLENDGATPFSSVGRESASVGITCAPDKATRLLPLLATECTFEKWDLKDAKDAANLLVEEAQANAQLTLTEQIYAAAYGRESSMGKTVYTASASSPGIISFRERNYGMKGAVLSATGISDHAAFVQAVSDGFSEANPGGSTELSTTAGYTGGESCLSAPSAGYTHLAVAFKGPDGNSALSNVVKHVMSLSAASEGVSAFAAPGLVGLYASSPAAASSGLVDAIASAVAGSLSDEVFARAKGLAKAEAVFNLDGGSKLLAEAMTTSILETGSFSGAAVSSSYDAITKEDVAAAITAAVKSNPSVAAIGDISAIPSHASIASKF